jgi:thiamine kinase-like enzyme
LFYFENTFKYPNFKAKHLKWLDTGNLDDLSRTKEYFDNEPLSLFKTTGEIVYKTDKFIKFHPDKNIIKNKSERAHILYKLVPSNFKNTDNFISYDWEAGNTLYTHDSPSIYNSFLDKLKLNISKSKQYKGTKELFEAFYETKTSKRVEEFTNKFGIEYINQKYNINNKTYDTLSSILPKIDISQFYNNPLYTLFHGDLQFDNIIYNPNTDKFTYIDWRESFGGSTEGGDIYYDLAKLYGGSIIPYNVMKDEDSILLVEGSITVSYSYPVSKNLIEFRKYYEKWIIENGFDLDKVKLITAIIFLNMSPLHDDKFGKMLWFKSIELFSEHNK